MKITLEQEGGWMAGLQQRPQTIDSAKLSKEAAAKLAPLISAAKAECKGFEGVGQARDAMTYKVTIHSDGGTTVFRASDANMPPALSSLIDWINWQQKGQ